MRHGRGEGTWGRVDTDVMTPRQGQGDRRDDSSPRARGQALPSLLGPEGPGEIVVLQSQARGSCLVRSTVRGWPKGSPLMTPFYSFTKGVRERIR